MLLLSVLVALVPGCAPRNATLRRLEGALDRAYGNSALAVGYQHDSTRLLIMLPGDSTRPVAESVLDSLTRALAVAAVRAHPNASVLRDITVMIRQEVDRGQWRILQTREVSPPSL